MSAGIMGICFGFLLSKSLRTKFKKADPVICGLGLLISAPFLLSATFAVTKSDVLSYLLLLAGEIALNLNWAICGDILLVRPKLLVLPSVIVLGFCCFWWQLLRSFFTFYFLLARFSLSIYLSI